MSSESEWTEVRKPAPELADNASGFSLFDCGCETKRNASQGLLHYYPRSIIDPLRICNFAVLAVQ